MKTATVELYYTPPSIEQFNEVRDAAIILWSSIGDYNYKKEKIGSIKELENIEDNFMFIVAMFDQSNQVLLADLLSEDTKKSIRERLIDGGMPKEHIVF